MVSGRHYNRHTRKDDGQHWQGADDLEANQERHERVRERFFDVAKKSKNHKDAEEFKNKLRSGFDRKELEKYRRSTEQIKELKDKKIKAFYEDQNSRLNDWLEVDALVMSMADEVLDSMNPQDLDHDGVAETGGALQREHDALEPLLPDDERERRRKGRRNARWAININVVANILLLAAKFVAFFYSSSLSLIASLVDSALDLLCVMIVWTTNRLVTWRLQSLRIKFPVGRKRLEPMGILVFSIIMIVSFLQILKESVEKLIPLEGEAVTLPTVAIASMAGTIGLKGIIWIGCARVKTTQVQALAQDCKTDVVFNTLSLLFPVIGKAAGIWWLDPAGAALLSLYIIFDWASTCLENVTRLTGSAAEDRILRKVLFLAWRFSPVVDAYKSIKAYHAGDGVWVEVDLLMDEKTGLKRSHDIAETLQYCLEGLGEVDRAFVTVDYTSQGPTGHSDD